MVGDSKIAADCNEAWRVESALAHSPSFPPGPGNVHVSRGQSALPARLDQGAAVASTTRSWVLGRVARGASGAFMPGMTLAGALGYTASALCSACDWGAPRAVPVPVGRAPRVVALER